MDRPFDEESSLSGRGDKVRGGLVVAANREPYIHRKTAGEIRLEIPTGGLVSALDTVLRITGGTWVAWGSGSGDREGADADGRVPVPPEDPAYAIRRLWFSRSAVNNYYHGFCNQVLWPLFHGEPDRIIFKERFWDAYQRTNRAFARAVLEEGGETATFWVHDYHLCLVPRMLRTMSPGRTIVHFWHIPWPDLDQFRRSPHGPGLLDGLLGNDLLCFQTPLHARNFLACAEACLGATVDCHAMTVAWNGGITRVRAFPVSADFHKFDALASSPETAARVGRIRKKHRLPALVGLGVDRLDYTKGIIERLQAIDLFFNRYRRFRGAFTFIQVAVMTRTAEPFLGYRQEVEELVARINGKYATTDWQPIVYRGKRVDLAELAACYRLADVAVVTPIRDGMNLVAKEYVAARGDGDGVLILGREAGAADELEAALLVDPHGVEEFAVAIHRALTMPASEKRARMERLREQVRGHTIHHWIGGILDELSLLPLVKEGGRHALAHREEIAGRLAGRALFLCFDFDGTLAPIAQRPELAQMPDEIRSLLVALRERHPVAVISGRSLADLRERVGIAGLIYGGNHGAELDEGEGGGGSLAGTRPLLAEFLARAQVLLAGHAGAFPEDKGVTASIHFRMVAPARQEELVAALRGLVREYAGMLQVTEGRKVLEVRPREAGDKGAAVTRLMADLGKGRAALYLGDDIADEEAFRAVRGSGIAVAVGGSPEADYYLRNQEEVRDFLEFLLSIPDRGGVGS